jgi:cytidine deaminase
LQEHRAICRVGRLARKRWDEQLVGQDKQYLQEKGEMDTEQEMLLNKAVEAMRNAHCPYSGYSVGAALLCADGTVFTGCNVENASYGLTLCAERTAVFTAVAAGRRDFTAIAITASGDALPSPCGACRQVLTEFCGKDFPVYVARANDQENMQTFTLGELLPHSFEI